MLYSAISLFLSKVGKNNKNWDQAKNKKQVQIKNDIRINIFNKDNNSDFISQYIRINEVMKVSLFIHLIFFYNLTS